MLIDRATATVWVRDLASRRWDATMGAKGGFARMARSLIWTRKVADHGRQGIHLHMYVRPRYAPDRFHLSLHCSVAFPAMARICGQMFGPEATSFARTGRVDMGLLDLIAPESRMVLFASPSELEDLGPEIERYLLQLVPYLDERTSVTALTAATLREWVDSGAEPAGGGRTPVFVAAGQLTMGDARQALRTLETAYPPGTLGRKDYAKAFDVVEAEID